MLFGFLLRLARGHVMDRLGKRADMRVSDRVFSHALRLRNSAIPRSTGSFISQLRELEQIREMVTSSTISTIVDLPFFFLFIVVLAIIAPPLAWIAPVAALLMILPGLLLQKSSRSWRISQRTRPRCVTPCWSKAFRGWRTSS